MFLEDKSPKIDNQGTLFQINDPLLPSSNVTSSAKDGNITKDERMSKNRLHLHLSVTLHPCHHLSYSHSHIVSQSRTIHDTSTLISIYMLGTKLHFSSQQPIRQLHHILGWIIPLLLFQDNVWSTKKLLSIRIFIFHSRSCSSQKISFENIHSVKSSIYQSFYLLLQLVGPCCLSWPWSSHWPNLDPSCS